MAVQTARRLPGFQFKVQPPPLNEVLPRMDVAIFVGFAATGPLHTPVVLEDAAHFAMVFGSDAPLAWDLERGENVYAFLAPAVRAFFRNGGKRCWVVRVAGTGATVNSFAVKTLGSVDNHVYVLLDAEGKPCPADLQARSAGSWSDNLEVAAELIVETLAADWAAPSVMSPPTSPPEDRPTFRLTLEPPNPVANGDLLRLTFLGDNDEQIALFLAVRTPKGQVALELTQATALLIRADELAHSPALAPNDLPHRLRGVERLTFNLRVRQRQDSSWQLRGLGFAPGHPRFWGLLPTDEQLYSRPETIDDAQRPGFWDVVTDPRFPLAAAANSGIRIPSKMPFLAIDEDFVGPDPQLATALARDGLERFDASLFFDGGNRQAFQSLLEAGAGTLLAEADFLRYQGTAPRSLGGVFAALDIDEATLISVPDAVHRGWSPAVGAPLASPVESQPPARPEWWHFLPCPPAEPFKRVRNPEPGHFLACDLRTVEAPVLFAPDDVRHPGTFTLTWTNAEEAVSVLEEAANRDFIDARTIYRGAETKREIVDRAPGGYYYRVRAEVGRVSSDYSNGVGIRVELAAGWQLNPIENGPHLTLLVVQRALLRLCAARADLFAILALPEHYREDDAVGHAALLTSPAGPKIDVYTSGPASGPGNLSVEKPDAVSLPLDGGEAAAFSFAALYHPWLVGREENASDVLRRTPPDGAAAGILAKRALSRGAWIAPANEPIQGVVALTPPIGRQSHLGFLAAQINLLRQEPHGLVAQSADTLSGDADLRPINVRRLLTLLRRLALRLGTAFVFEPNDDSLRRSVERSFESQLEYLFVRGAFAGGTPATSFQVVVTSSANALQSMDQGRFIVELRVAPSLPLTFLTIRLVQTGDRGLVTEVR